MARVLYLYLDLPLRALPHSRAEPQHGIGGISSFRDFSFSVCCLLLTYSLHCSSFLGDTL